MAKAIGPNWIAELKAAGVTFDGWAWGADGSFNFGSLPQATRDQIQAVYAAHNPATPEADSEKESRFTSAFDSPAGLMLKAGLLSLRVEINALRTGLDATRAGLDTVRAELDNIRAKLSPALPAAYPPAFPAAFPTYNLAQWRDKIVTFFKALA